MKYWSLVASAFVGWFLLFAWAASAQTINSYELRAYAVGATAPIQTFTFPAVNTTCNVLPTLGGFINPTTAEWDDPGNMGRVCRFIQGSGTLFSVPIPGMYEATLVAVNTTGSSGESNRAPFERLDAPGAPSGLRLLRP